MAGPHHHHYDLFALNVKQLVYFIGCKLKHDLHLLYWADCSFIAAFNFICPTFIDDLQEDESRPDCLYHQGRSACSYILAGHFLLFHRHTIHQYQVVTTSMMMRRMVMRRMVMVMLLMLIMMMLKCRRAMCCTEM